jgi:hypothetical protein
MNDSGVAGRPVRSDLLGSKRPAQVHGIKSLTQQLNNKLSTYVRARKLQHAPSALCGEVRAELTLRKLRS